MYRTEETPNDDVGYLMKNGGAGVWGIVIVLMLVLLVNQTAAQTTVVDHTCTNLGAIPSYWIERASKTLAVSFNHTCPGSHIISGMNALEEFPSYGSKYAWSRDGSEGLLFDDRGVPCAVQDLGQGDYIDQNEVTPWVTCVRRFLDSPENSHINVVIWSWCSVNGHDVNRYLENMEILIAEYPEVNFVYMTGHLQGQGADPTPRGVHSNNELIRKHCRAMRRYLLDIAHIEAYDPDGNYFGDRSAWDNLDYCGGNWGHEWISENPQS